MDNNYYFAVSVVVFEGLYAGLPEIGAGGSSYPI